MKRSPMGPSMSSTSNRCPVARPTLARGKRRHHHSICSRLVLASFSPWAVMGCLPIDPQSGSPQEQPTPEPGRPLGLCEVSAGLLERAVHVVDQLAGLLGQVGGVVLGPGRPGLAVAVVVD